MPTLALATRFATEIGWGELRRMDGAEIDLIVDRIFDEEDEPWRHHMKCLLRQLRAGD